jgi:hypothetical protein
MIGNKDRMPKRARFPLFLMGLLLMLVGGLAAQAFNEGLGVTSSVVGAGFCLILSSVLFR